MLQGRVVGCCWCCWLLLRAWRTGMHEPACMLLLQLLLLLLRAWTGMHKPACMLVLQQQQQLLLRACVRAWLPA